jgi:hypothetical protein
MSNPRSVLGILVCLGLSVAAILQAAPTNPGEAEKINRLITDLGSSRYGVRIKATRALDALGPKALAALEGAAHSQDAEVARRARELAQKIGRRLEVAKILAGQRVRLVYKNKPVLEAIKDFTKKTGIQIQLEGDTKVLGTRTVTLDTGDIPPMQAFDLLCQKCGLVDSFLAPPPPAKKRASRDDRERMMEMIAIMQQREAGTTAGKNRTFALVPGKLPALPTLYAGAVRIRALPPSTPVTDEQKMPNEILFALEVTPEPEMHWQHLIELEITRAVDEHGQVLKQPRKYVNPYVGNQNSYAMWVDYSLTGNNNRTSPDQVPVLLTRGKKSSKLLKELKGTLWAQVETPAKPLITVDKILQASGRKFTGGEASLKVKEVIRQKDGQIKLRVELDTGHQDNRNQFGVGRVVMVNKNGQMIVSNSNGSDAADLSLVDDKGRPFRLVTRQNRFVMNANMATPEIHLVFQPQKGQSSPARLIYLGRQKRTVKVVFQLKNVQLP